MPPSRKFSAVNRMVYTTEKHSVFYVIRFYRTNIVVMVQAEFQVKLTAEKVKEDKQLQC